MRRAPPVTNAVCISNPPSGRDRPASWLDDAKTRTFPTTYRNLFGAGAIKQADDDPFRRRPRAMTETLVERACTPCQGGVPPLSADEAGRFRAQAPDWSLLEDARRIERIYRFGDFREALALVERVGALAEAEGHDPDLS